MKNKFKLFTGISFGVSLCAATSIPLTMNFKDYKQSVVKPIVPENKYETPILKDNITFAGTINQLIKSDGRSDDVNENLDTIFNGNKKALIENYDKVNQSDFESLEFSSEILGWNNWGDLTFDQWKNQNQQENQKQQNEQPQDITQVKYDNEIINFTSKDQLKSYLETNLSTILTSFPNAKLADVDFGVNDIGDLLIPITNTKTPESSFKMYSISSIETTNTIDKIILQIPSDKINFSPQIRVSGSYGVENQTNIESKNVSFKCEIINETAKPITFVGDATNKKTITLKDKGVKDNTIQLYDTIKDEDVYKALGWLNDDSTLVDHTDGQDMDISLLNEEKIYSDLGINKLTDELFGIKLEFVKGENSRNVNNESYDGEYKITIETIDLSDDYDINLKFKTYEVVSDINHKTNDNTPLQLLVPNAYIIDTSLDNGKVMYIKNTFFNNNSFEMGFKKSVSPSYKQANLNTGTGSSGSSGDNTYSTATDGIIANLQNSIIFDKFIKKIDDSSKQKKIDLHNGVNLIFKNASWNDNNDENFKDTIILTIQLKKGFAFKDAFNLVKSDQITKNETTYKYNTNGKTTEVSFGINHNENNNYAAIYKNYTKTVEEVAGENNGNQLIK